ncbi:MAG: phytoene/squalene synthase family protein [Alphaproteobacteria bacterium]
MSGEKLLYCAQIVKEQDPDRFLLAMMMPTQYRDDLIVLFAFYHEIAKTREVVTETRLGQIRLKWWQEAIREIYNSGKVLQHEVLQALAGVIERRGLEYQDFETLIFAREFDLEDVLPGNLEGLVNYCDFTLSPLFRLVLQIMGETPENDMVQAVAVNYAIIGLMRAVPFHASQRRCYLPEDLLARHGQSLNQLYEMKPSDDLPEIVREVLSVFEKNIKPHNKFLKASQQLSCLYESQLRSAHFDPFAKKMALPPPFKVLRLVFSYKFL